MMIKKIVLPFLLSGFLHLANAQKSSYIDSLKRELASSTEEDTAKIILLNKLSFEYIWSIADSGRKYAEEALRLSKKIDYKKHEGVSYFNLCICLIQAGNFTGALSYGFKSLSIFEKIQDTEGIVNGHTALMICYREQGDYTQALLQGYKAKELQQRTQANPLLRSIILSNISSVYERSDQLDSAIYYALKAYELSKRGNSISITLGNIYSKMGKQEMALDHFRKGIFESREEQSGWSLMDIYQGMSKTFESTRKMDSAILYAQKSFFTGRAIENPRGMLEASKQLAHLYEIKGINDSTVKYLKLAATLNDSLFSRQKTRDAQNFAFNEKIHQQELEAQQLHDINKTKMFALLGVVFIFLLIAFGLWRNNKHKQLANRLLNEQKEKVETALSELKTAQAQLVQSEKMASLGELTAGIAHEIQNPLNFVNNFSEVNTELIEEMKTELEAGNKEDAIAIANDIKENEQKINMHGKRADSIVKGMLQHSRNSTAQKELTDINTLVDECMRLSWHGFRSKEKSVNIILETDFDTGIEKINVISQDVGRVFLNLFNNAFYSVAEKKKSFLTTAGSVDGYEPKVSASTKRMADRVEIKIRDNGTGISQAALDKIFNPFFTTKPTGQGTGLGLSLSYDIITKGHAGELKAVTKEDEFAEFVISLPAPNDPLPANNIHLS